MTFQLNTEWHIRSALPDDAELLQDFRCVVGDIPYEREVERFVTTHLLPWGHDPSAAPADPRILLMLFRRTGELIGVAGHEQATLSGPHGQRISATKLEVVALSVSWQGKSFDSGDRASDVLMSAVMQDIRNRRPPRDARVFALVHEANHRSARLCQRFGLTQEMSRPHPAYRRLITPGRPG